MVLSSFYAKSSEVLKKARAFLHPVELPFIWNEILINSWLTEFLLIERTRGCGRELPLIELQWYKLFCLSVTVRTNRVQCCVGFVAIVNWYSIFEHILLIQPRRCFLNFWKCLRNKRERGSYAKGVNKETSINAIILHFKKSYGR